MNNIAIAIVIFIIAVLLGVVNSEIKIKIKGEQPICTTTKLSNSSLIVCTYKNKVLFNGEVENE